MKLSFKNWMKIQETGTGSGDVAGYARPFLGYGGNAFIAGDAQQQAADCGLAMCGGGLPRKKRKKKKRKHHKKIT